MYVKRWLKTKHAIIFRLSNKIVQVPRDPPPPVMAYCIPPNATLLFRQQGFFVNPLRVSFF